jgi:O-antigen ligase
MLPKLTFLCLLVHLLSLAATQTAYGTRFLQLRWYSLFALFAVGFAAWISAGRRHRRMGKPEWLTLGYLSLWGVTVVGSEYPLFSSYRWLAHVMIVLSALLFMPSAVRTSNAKYLYVGLKLMAAVTLVASYAAPAPTNVFDDARFYRGAFGNANAMGHMSAMGFLLFVHGFLTRQRGSPLRLVEAVLAILSLALLAKSGARSSVLGLLGGAAVLYLLYRQLMRNWIVLAVLGLVMAVVFLPTLATGIESFLFKHSEIGESTDRLQRLTRTRSAIWQAHFDGFCQRPILGWGFGVDSATNLTLWKGEFSALGFVGRDPINDVLYSMEMGGLIGLTAYAIILMLVIRTGEPVFMKWRRKSVSALQMDHRFAPLVDIRNAFFCITVCLMVTFLFDNTAFAAGNLFAGCFWTCMGLTLGVNRILLQAAPTQQLNRSVVISQSVPLAMI